MIKIQDLILAPQRFLKVPSLWKINFNLKFLSYIPTYDVHIETNKYILKSATRNMLEEIFELRYQIFLEDGSEEEDVNYDVDQFDPICDHIAIIDKETQKIVGTYRLLCSQWTNHYYSQGEFNIDKFLIIEGVKVELGRACIHHGHRNGAVIDLLWRGIGEYCLKTKAKYLFGCSSVHSIERGDALQLVKYFQNENLSSDEFQIGPINQYNMRIEDCEVESTELDNEEAKRVLPSLLRSYLQAGAKVYGKPALDLDFDCMDFFTIIDLDKLNQSYRKRYFKTGVEC